MILIKRIAALAAAFGLLAAAGLVNANAAFGEPPEPGNASCMGYEASAVSPPGTSDEAPGGMPELLAGVDAFFVAPNGPLKNRGAVIRLVTKLEADSHEGCDEAIEALFEGGG